MRMTREQWEAWRLVNGFTEREMPAVSACHNAPLDVFIFRRQTLLACSYCEEVKVIEGCQAILGGGGDQMREHLSLCCDRPVRVIMDMELWMFRLDCGLCGSPRGAFSMVKAEYPATIAR